MKTLLVATVVSLATIENEKARSAVINQENRALMPLMAAPNLGDCYLDLRTICKTDKRWIDEASRVGSLSDAGRRQLVQHLFSFIARVDLGPALDKVMSK